MYESPKCLTLSIYIKNTSLVYVVPVCLQNDCTQPQAKQFVNDLQIFLCKEELVSHYSPEIKITHAVS